MDLWRDELLPSIHKLIKTENKQIHDKISDLNMRFIKLEESQQFLSNKYDEILQSLQSTKKNILDHEQRITNAVGEIGHIREINYQQDVAIDDMQQYLRRDCLEITGIPTVPDENTTGLVIELASAIGVNLDDKDISIAHRLPESRKVKDRLIVKFTRRVKRDEVYKKRSILKKQKF